MRGALGNDPHAALAGLHEGPPVFFSASGEAPGRGAWYITRMADLRYVLTNPATFSSVGSSGFARLVGEMWSLIPLELDPPDHLKFRNLLNPLFSPPAVAKMRSGIEARAVELIEPIRREGGCEFVSAFGRPFPVGIFLQLMGLPLVEMSTFLRWESDLLHSPKLEAKSFAAKEILGYLRDLLCQRRRAPTDDLISFAASAKLDGIALTDDEIIGICFLLFVGGLDTVASSLGFHFRYLAQHAADQALLRAEPQRIPKAVEELLRAFSPVLMNRRVMNDTELGGVQIKAGDRLLLATMTGNRDPEEFADPDRVQLDRKLNRHVAFSYGIHFCIGNHLARMELAAAQRAWFDLTPPFHIAPGEDAVAHGGTVFGVARLPLAW